MITVVVPCYNEKAILPVFFERVSSVLNKLDESSSFEVIVVDDGSDDDSWGVITGFHGKDARWKGIRFARNFGQQKAISAGLWHTEGDCVIVLDADLQDPPEEINSFIKKWKEGFQVVYAVRTKRKEMWLKRISYKWFYRLLTFMSEVNIPCDSGDFCLMDRKVVDVLNSMPEQDRYVRGMRAWAGFRQVGLEYERDARAAGVPKYSLRKLMRLAFSGISSFTVTPLQVATSLGVVLSVIAGIGALLTMIGRAFVDRFSMPGSCVPWGLVVVFLGGVQLICIGILGGYIGRIYMEVKRRPLWVVADTIGLKVNPPAGR